MEHAPEGWIRAREAPAEPHAKRRLGGRVLPSHENSRATQSFAARDVKNQPPPGGGFLGTGTYHVHEHATAAINQGLSRGARIAIGVTTALCGAAMFLVAPASTEPRAIKFHAFSVFCFLLTAACFTTGRVRQFFGSVIGFAIFLLGVAYLADELRGGALGSGSRANPSVANAVTFLLFIGAPGAAYAWKARFGFRKPP